jgi:arginine decarboxylase
VYVELVRLGAGLKYIDVGGGLGVDYDGSQSNVASSINYTLQEYASDIVYRVGNVCTSYGVAHPTIVTESGRATVAYHSVLVFNVVGSSGLDRFRVERPAQVDERGNERPQPLADLFDAYESVGEQRLLECYHDAVQARQQAQQLFSLGYMTLEGRGLAERLYWATLARIRDVARRMEAVPEDLAHLETMLSETYFCNVSVFQSLPDSWAIGQLFPIMPIHRLDEQPLRKAVLADITCDSDGKIDCFVDQGGSKSTLDLHELQPGESYYLAAFLVGAYQEPLGDLHNLFGDTHVVHVRVDPEAGWWIDEIVKGETARDVLRYVQFEADRLQPRLARDCERAVRDRRMSVEETQVLLRFYEAEMNGYTYLQ